MAEPVYGLDHSVLAQVSETEQDFDLTFAPIGDGDALGSDPQEVLLQDVFKQVTTPAGSCFWAPTRTLDLRDYLLASLSTSELASLGKRLEQIFDEDPRMAVAATVTQDGVLSALTLRVELAITPTRGATFQAVITAGSNQVVIEKV